MDDIAYMEHALKLATKGVYTTLPNPRVGCVIVKDGRIVGEGWHERAGDDHAEAMALRQAKEHAQGADVYVTLEPCMHWGKTPPCCDALIAAKVARVIIATQDSTEKINGQSMMRLQQQGIRITSRVLSEKARALNPGFFSLAEKRRPWIRIKSAITLDGRISLESGESNWISGEASRADVQRWRAQSDVLLTGFGTVLTDDPRLNVRLNSAELGISGQVRQPLRLVVDSQLRTDPHAKIYQGKEKAVVATCNNAPSTVASFTDKNIAVWQFNPSAKRVPLVELFRRLGNEGFCEAQVEAGSGLVGALLQEELCDELLLYVAPTVFGSGRPLARMESITTMAQKHRFIWQNVTRIDDDLRILLHKENP